MRKLLTSAILILCGFTVYSQTITPAGPVSFCEGSGIDLTASAGDRYQWQRNGLPVSGATARTYRATDAGIYTVIIYTGSIPATSPGVTVTRNAKPTVSFDNPTGTVCSGAPASFSSTVTGGQAPYNFNWSFGGGGSSADANPTNRFTAVGCGTTTFSNQLTVRDDNGCTNTITQSLVVQRAPDVVLSDPDNPGNPWNNCARTPDPSSPNFTIRVVGTSPNASCIASYTLNWGDGSPLVTGITAASFPLTHTYTRTGAFPMVITAIGTNGCSNSKTYTVVNQSNPDIGIATVGATESCAPLTMTALVTNWQLNSPGTTYELRFGDGGVKYMTHPINNTNSDEVVSHTYTTTSCPGSPDFPISITARNGCRTKTFSGGNIVVRTPPDARFIVTNTACAGQPTCFADASEGYLNNCSTAGTFRWDFGDPGSGTNNISTATNPCHTYSRAGTYTVTITKTNPCGTSTKSYQVCVNPPSTAQFDLDNDKVCVGSTVIATNRSATGNCSSTTYTWEVFYSAGFCGTSPFGWSFTNGTYANSVSPAFRFNEAGTYTIRMRLSGACGNGIVDKIVQVKNKPKDAQINTFPSVCGVATISPRLNYYVNCGADPVRYLWEFDNGTVGTSTNANPGNIVFNNPGNHTVKLTISNECGTNEVAEYFTTYPIPEITVPASRTLCGGTPTGTLAISATVPGTDVRWTNNNPAIGLYTSGSGSIPSFIATNNGSARITATITVTARSVNNCTSSKTFTLSVDPKPALPVVASTVNYCQNVTPVPLAATITPGNTIRWFTTATGGTPSSTAPTPVTSSPGVTYYYVSQLNPTTNCESDRAVIVVTVTGNFSITGSTVENPTQCSTPSGAINLSGLVPGATYTIQYTRNGVSATATATANVSGVVRLGNLTAGTYANIVLNAGGCNSNTAGPFTLTDPSPPPPPAPGTDPTVCEGTPLALQATSTTPGVTWQWTGPGGFSSTQQNPIISYPVPGNSGVYSVKAVLNNCPSTAVQIRATVHPRPLAPTVNPNIATCLNQALQFSATTSFSGPVTWSWRGPNGFSSADQNPVIASATNANAGLYAVRVTSVTGNCASPESNISAVIKPVPVISGSSFVNPVGCSSSNGIIALTGLLPVTQYEIRYYRNGVLQPLVYISSAPDGNVLVTGLPSGLYTDVTASLGGCASNSAGPFRLDDTPPFSVITESNNSICNGSDLQFFARATSPGSAMYSWTGPNGFTSNAQNPIIPNATPANSGIYEVSITINGCTGRNAVTATVSLPSVGGQTDGDANVCPGQNNGAVSLSGHLGQVIRWESSINGGLSWSPIAANLPVLPYSDVSTNTWYRAVVQSGGCPPASSDATEISMRKGVRSVDMAPGLVSTCNHDTLISFSASAIDEGAGAIKYYWYVDGQVVGNGDRITHRFQSPEKNPEADDFNVWVVAENTAGCQLISSESKVVIQALPIPEIAISPSNIQREPKYNFIFTDQSKEEPGDSYLWNIGDPASPLKEGREVSYNYRRTGTFEVGLYVYNRNTGCEARDTVRVTVIPVPGSLVVPNAFYPNSAYPEIRTFQLKGIGMVKYHLQIYDSWGKVVFETKELNADGSPKVSWNGRYMNTGQPLPQDAYTWKVVEVVFENGRSWNGMSYNGGPAKHFGTVTLFR